MTQVETRSEIAVCELLLAGAPEQVALTDGQQSMTYAELAHAVHDAAGRLGPVRQLVVVTMRNRFESVIELLAALTAGFPVVLVGAEEAERHHEIVDRYAGARELHPDLALLLSTSGSTGSPKLVRLSWDNIMANARSIASYLDLTPQDRAITSLPLHYCYGLSVLTSHLAAGASVILTELSVADECFWELAAAERATSFAGVPYTFELLTGSGFAERDLPHLRYVTQAGGRMHPERVRHFAELGQARGYDLFVMYGQTEATARMAFVPPDRCLERPETIGIPIPGGSFRIAPLADAGPQELASDDEVGELVFSGPNVMMGYAETAADLARPAELTELHTGDLARRHDDGLWQIVGRIDRHTKVFGLRLDLDRLESAIEFPVALVTVGDRLHAYLARPRERARVHRHLIDVTGLPASAVEVHQVEGFPTTARGKIDYAALRQESARIDEDRAQRNHCGALAATPEALRDLYAVALGRPDATTQDSFVALGGDSLSFVEVSVQLGRRLGHLPASWQHQSPIRLAAQSRRSRWWATPVETPVVLRAVAIILILLAHADLWLVMGGAHVLLAVAGYNLARFVLPVDGRRRRVGRLLGAVGAFAVPASLWIGVTGAVTGDYDLATAFYLNQFVGDDAWSTNWQFWFLDVLVWTFLGMAVLLLVPWIDRWQRRWSFHASVGLLVFGLALRYSLVGVGADDVSKYAVPVAFWCVAAGIAAAEAQTLRQRLLVGLVVVAGVAGFFPEDVQRQAVVAVGIVALLLPWGVRVPRPVVAPIQAVAAASLWIYLTHWQVYPDLEASGRPLLGVGASVAVGLGVAWLVRAVELRGRQWSLSRRC